MAQALVGVVQPLCFLDDGSRSGDLLEHDVALDEPRQPHGCLVVEERLGGDGKDLVDFLERELFGFADKSEDHAPGDEVESGVEAESTGGSHDSLHAREGQTENTS